MQRQHLLESVVLLLIVGIAAFVKVVESQHPLDHPTIYTVPFFGPAFVLLQLISLYWCATALHRFHSTHQHQIVAYSIFALATVFFLCVPVTGIVSNLVATWHQARTIHIVESVVKLVCWLAFLVLVHPKGHTVTLMLNPLTPVEPFLDIDELDSVELRGTRDKDNAEVINRFDRFTSRVTTENSDSQSPTEGHRQSHRAHTRNRSLSLTSSDD
jgi:hypothetical protein